MSIYLSIICYFMKCLIQSRHPQLNKNVCLSWRPTEQTLQHTSPRENQEQPAQHHIGGDVC